MADSSVFHRRRDSFLSGLGSYAAIVPAAELVTHHADCEYLMRLPKETVRRKVGILIKKKLINHSRKDGLLPTDKVEEAIKPFAIKELNELSLFLKALKKHNTLNQLLDFKD